MPADIALPFSRAEYQQRLDKTRTAMANAGIDVLFVADPSNVGWLTGFDAWSFHTCQGVVVSLDQDPIYWGRQQDTNAARRTTWIDDEQIVPYPEDYVQTPERHPVGACQELCVRGSVGGGVDSSGEGDGERLECLAPALGVGSELASSVVSDVVDGEVQDLVDGVVGGNDPRVLVTLRSW